MQKIEAVLQCRAAFSLSGIGKVVRMARIIVLSMMAVLVACGPADSDPGPGGVSVEDARALDEAAAKLDAQMSADHTTDAEAE